MLILNLLCAKLRNSPPQAVYTNFIYLLNNSSFIVVDNHFTFFETHINCFIVSSMRYFADYILAETLLS